MLTPWMHSLSHSVSSLSVGVYQDSRTRLAARRDVYRIMMKEAKPVDTLCLCSQVQCYFHKHLLSVDLMHQSVLHTADVKSV